MLKAEEHDTDRAGRLIFSEIFERLNWIPNRVSEDYGIDYNVQAFDQQQPTGAWFQVQLKSSRSLSLIDSGRFVALELDLAHLLHYSLESKQPVFLVLVDVSSRILYWTCPLLDAERIREAEKVGRKTLTLRIPVSQTLPESANQFIEALRTAYLVLAAREISTTSIASFDAALKEHSLDGEILYGLQEKYDHQKLLKIAEAFRDGRFDEADVRIQGVLTDLDATVPAKFQALVQQNAIDFRRALLGGVEAIDITDGTFIYARRLRSLGSREHKWVRLAAVLVHSTAQIERAVALDSADWMALSVHAQTVANPVVTLGLLARRASSAREIIRLFNRAISTLKFINSTPSSLRLGRLVTRVATSIAPYLIALESSKSSEVAEAFVKSALQILDLSIDLVTAAGDERGVGVAVLAALPLTHREDSEAFRWASEAKSRISDPRESEEIGRLIERTRLRWTGVEVEGDVNPDPLWQIFQKIARSVRIDISDESSLLVRRLRIAAADNSPEPWLRFCSHLVLSTGSISPVDVFIRQNFAVETSPNKICHCNLLNLHYEATCAEAAVQKLKTAHCNSCVLRKPRPSEWAFTDEERNQWNLENSDFIAQAAQQGYGARFTHLDALGE